VDNVLGSAGIELIFRSSWLGWPKQPVKWDILYHVLSCSVFKWGPGWRRGFCYSGAAEQQVMRTLHVVYAFYQYYWLLFSSPFAILLNCSHPSPRVLAFILLILLHIPLGRGKEQET